MIYKNLQLNVYGHYQYSDIPVHLQYLGYSATEYLQQLIHELLLSIPIFLYFRLQGWGSLTMAFTGKFVYKFVYI